MQCNILIALFIKTDQIMRNFLTILILVLLNTSVLAEEFKSAYSNVDVSKCKLIDKAKPGDGEWAQWLCKGYDGIDVYVLEGDLRFYITFDKKAEGRQTLPPFNNIGKNLEWRLSEQGKHWLPHATILRYYTDTSSGKKGQVLVVSKYDNGESCHMAYIDALANKNANKLAHFIADKLSENFDCAKDQAIIVGKSGESPM